MQGIVGQASDFVEVVSKIDWTLLHEIWWTVREIPRSRYSHATTWQHLCARKLFFHTRSVHSRTRASAQLVSTTMDFRAFVAKAPHLTIPRQRTLVYGGKLIFSDAAAKLPKPISQKRHDGFSFLNDWNLDKCLSKKKIRLATPALWLSSPHWPKCMTKSKFLETACKNYCTHTVDPICFTQNFEQLLTKNLW